MLLNRQTVPKERRFTLGLDLSLVTSRDVWSWWFLRWAFCERGERRCWRGPYTLDGKVEAIHDSTTEHKECRFAVDQPFGVRKHQVLSSRALPTCVCGHSRGTVTKPGIFWEMLVYTTLFTYWITGYTHRESTRVTELCWFRQWSHPPADNNGATSDQSSP
jgi:hypothetical protein